MGDSIKLNVDATKGGISIGKFNITTEQITYAVTKIITIAAILILMYIVVKIGCSIIHKFMERQRQSNLKFTLNEKRSKTLEAISKSILKYTVYFFGIVGILTQVFGTVSLTFAGIGGVAIGFGAQNLVKDIINGFFILLEDQYAVGDYINIDDKGGIVESIELRVTKLRDFNGDLHIIPNGLIAKVTNHSRGDIRVLIDIEIPYEEDIDKVSEILNGVCENFKENNEDMVEGPKVTGVASLKENSITLRVVGKAKQMTQWDCEMALRKELRIALDKENVHIPYHKTKVLKEE